MHKIDKNIPIPLYYQLKEILLNDIKSKVYAPGDPIPTELDIVKKYDVSRTTVRQAISSLVNDGWLKRYKGVGTFVTEQNRPVSGALDVATIIKNNGYYLTTRLVNFQIVPADAIISEALKVPPKTPLYMVERLRLGNRRHVSYSKNYLPVEYLPDLEKDLELAVTGLNNYCDNHGYPVTTVTQKLSVIRADEECARILDIPVQTPILLMTNVCCTPEGLPVGYGLSALYSEDLSISSVGQRVPSVPLDDAVPRPSVQPSAQREELTHP